MTELAHAHFVPGRSLELSSGTTYIRELEGPPGAPVVVLAHGLSASGGMNWHPAMEHLARHFRVIAIDHRGHAAGIRSNEPFTLEACADDIAEAMDLLGVDSAIIAGYSMGGPIAQLTWQRHPEKVAGLVLCATAARFPSSALGEPVMALREARQTLTPPPLRRLRGLVCSLIGRLTDQPALVEMGQHDPLAITQAIRELGRFNSLPWLHRVDVPTTVVFTERDLLVPPAEQELMQASIPGAKRVTVRSPWGHLACALATGEFVPALVRACREVAARGRAGMQGAALA